jgi:outer membrane receptor protein involved in Fe transport
MRKFKLKRLAMTLMMALAGVQVTVAENPDIKVLVTANRIGERDALSIPQAVASLSQDDIGAGSFTDIDDLLRTVPNVGMAPLGINSNYWQEGFSLRGLGAQRVLTLTDGVRQAGQGIGYGGGNLSLYDLYSVERIEVVKGPASVHYGTDAFGGVINVITRKPTERTEFGAKAGTRLSYDGTQNLSRTSARVDFGNETVGTVLGTTYSHANEINLPDGKDSNAGDFRAWDFWGKSEVKLSDDTKLRLIGNMNRTADVRIEDSSAVLPIAVFPPGSSAPITTPVYFRIPQYQRSLLGTEITSSNISDTFAEFRSGIYWQQIKREFSRDTGYYTAGSPGFAGPPLFFNPQAAVAIASADTADRTNTVEWQTLGRINSGNHSLAMGLDVGYDSNRLPETASDIVVGQAGIGSVTRAATTSDRIRARASQYRVGAFVEDRIEMDKLAITPGIRVDSNAVRDAETDFDDNLVGLSGSVNTLWRANNQQSWYGTVASGYRAPDLGERFQNAIVNLGAPTQIIGKNELDPERAFSLEAGFKHMGESTTFEAASYYNRIRDYIGLNSLGVVRGVFTEQYENLGTVSLYGAETGITHKVNEKTEVYFNTGRTWSKERERVDLPSWAFNYGVRRHVPVSSKVLEKASVALNLRSVLDSDQKTAQPGREPFPNDAGFTKADLIFSVDLKETKSGKGRVQAGIKNLADERYKEPFFNRLQAGRSAFINVEYNF